MKAYKLVTGFNAEDYIEINEDELEKAYYCFLEKKDAVFSGGAVRGSRIQEIKPDYHRAMGWNRGHKLEALDYAQLSEEGIDRAHMTSLAAAKTNVHHLITTGQTNLIGSDVKRIVN